VAKYLTPAEARAEIGEDKISERTIKRAIAAGEIGGLKIRNVYLVSAEWLASVTAWPPQEGEEVA
jgi:hypothetical protein